ncbi:Mur ligase family protein [Mycoplasmatota bacterium WC44]
MNKYFLIGIKGSGMSSLASILHDLGHYVEGSDKNDYFFTEETLKRRSIVIHSYSKKNITDEFIYIKGNSVENDEVIYVKEMSYKLYTYNDFINEYFKGIKIAVTGTHGKTTTTKLLSHILSSFYKVSYLIGDSTGIGIKDYTHFVFEACEYKDHFLVHEVDYGVITNIDFDHPDYFKDLKHVQDSFNKFSLNANKIIINGDYNIKNKNKITFGFTSNYDYYCKILDKNENGYKIEINYDFNKAEIDLPFYGDFMILNFLAAFTLSYELGVPIDVIKESIKNFSLPKRRFSEYTINNQFIVDDYAHHPNEIKVSLDAIKQKYNRKIILVFQPHTYTRTSALLSEFNKVLGSVEYLYIDEVFSSAREKDQEVNELLSLDNAIEYNRELLNQFLGNNEYVIVFMGAGDINHEINYIK